ncbi:MAG: hypothetical protein KatS3mg129_1656 [Leptospiraceae bacterium]|nr:MAG: hypothetical protein KatS3mg129_1656 [Leptospiraceae bacterium]
MEIIPSSFNKLFEDLKNIQNNNSGILKEKWEELLNKHHPDWKKLIKNKKNWEGLEQLSILTDYKELLNLFIQTAGIELVIYLFYSSVKN